MKELSAEETRNLSIEKAFEIIQDYGILFASGEITGLYEFEDKLPWSKSAILLAAVKLLKYMRKNKLTENDGEFIENMSSLVVRLPDFIPSPGEYEKLLKVKDMIGERIEDLE